MDRQWYQYGGVLYEIHDAPGPFHHNAPRFTAVRHMDGWMDNEDDPSAILEIVIRGHRVNEDGSGFTPPVKEPLILALEKGEADGWLSRDGSGFVSEITQEDAARKIYRYLKKSLPSEAGRGLRALLSKAGINVTWPKNRKNNGA